MPITKKWLFGPAKIPGLSRNRPLVLNYATPLENCFAWIKLL